MTEQSVYIARGKPNKNKCYHLGEDCHAAQAARNIEETTKERAETRGLEPCRICTGARDPTECDRSYLNALKEAAKSD